MYKYQKPIYNNKELGTTWSQKSLKEKYLPDEISKTWQWRMLPNFDLNENLFEKPKNKIKGNILEIGSSTGGAYTFLKNSKLLDQHINYTGMDISDYGIDYCKKNFKEAKWIKSDLTKNEIKQNYDYIFERISVHHMENPLEIFEKLILKTNKSLATSFVSCVEGTTISDLNLARYRHASGECVYFNIINIFEVFEIFLSKFNFIHFTYGGPHEKLYNDPMSFQYLSPEIDCNKRRIGRCSIVASQIDAIEGKKIVFFNKSNIFKSCIKNLLNIFSSKYRDDFKIIQDRSIKFLQRNNNSTVYKSPYAPTS